MALITRGFVSNHGAPTNGTSDCATAAEDFRQWVLADQISNPTNTHALDLEAARTYAFPGYATPIFSGIKNLTVVGRGATLSDGGSGGPAFFLGGDGVRQNDDYSATFATVAAGASAITLNNIVGNISLFTAGLYVLVTGFDLQGSYLSPYGYPQNPQFFEYIRISNITGNVITFDRPLRNSYKDTWPRQNSGNNFEVDNGGPATVYALSSTWDMAVEYQDLTIDKTGQQTYSNARSVTYRNVTATGSHGPIPTQNILWACYDCNFPGVNMEIDKLIETMIFTRSTCDFLKFQSSSTEALYMEGSNILTAMSGSPKKCYLKDTIIGANCINSITTQMPGAYAYGSGGVNGGGYFENCQFLLGSSGTQTFTGGGYSLSGMINRASGITNGVIRYPRGELISNLTDNGSGKIRLTVPSTTGFTTGQYSFVQNVSEWSYPVTNCTNAGGLIKVFISNDGVNTFGTANLTTGDVITITGVTGTTEANGNWTITVVDADEITLTGSTFSHAYVSGGTMLAGNVEAFGENHQVTVVNSTTIDLSTNFSGRTYQGNGKITAGGTGGDALAWAAPGSYCAYYPAGPNFQVQDAYEDSDFIYVDTGLTGGFPTGATGGYIYPGPRITMTGCTAGGLDAPRVEELNLAGAQGKPLGAYVFRTYDENTTTNASGGIRPSPLGGLGSLKINVVEPYTGVGTLNFYLSAFNNWLWYEPNATDHQFTISVNAKIAGERVLIPGSTPSGGKIGDSLPDLTAYPTLWIAGPSNSNPVLDTSVSGQGLGPVITVEFVMNTGVPTIVLDSPFTTPATSSSFRLRLR